MYFSPIPSDSFTFQPQIFSIFLPVALNAKLLLRNNSAHQPHDELRIRFHAWCTVLCFQHLGSDAHILWLPVSFAQSYKVKPQNRHSQ